MAMGVRGWARETRGCTNRMVAHGPGRRAVVLRWASGFLPQAVLAQVGSLPPAQPGEVACAGRGVRPISDEPNVRCPDWSTDGVCPPGCRILSAQDHCGSVCTAGPTVAVIASVLVVIVFVAGMVLGTTGQQLSKDRSPRASDDGESSGQTSPSRTPNGQESGGQSRAPKRDGSQEFSSVETFENAVSESTFENAVSESGAPP